MTKRVTYVKRSGEADYVDARWDVMLDGVKVGEVTRDRRAKRHGYANSMLGYDTYGTAWQCEGSTTTEDGRRIEYRTFGMDYSTRMDAVIDYLRFRGMNWTEAREAVGKRGL